jgi:hypothetical protein
MPNILLREISAILLIKRNEIWRSVFSTCFYHCQQEYQDANGFAGIFCSRVARNDKSRLSSVFLRHVHKFMAADKPLPMRAPERECGRGGECGYMLSFHGSF